MRRRQFIAGVGASAVVGPRVASGQVSDNFRQVGVLIPFAETDAETRVHLDLFRQRLAQLGWYENRNLRITIRYGAGNVEQIRALAKELVSLKPDLILARLLPRQEQS